jgi:hypothetical protein
MDGLADGNPMWWMGLFGIHTLSPRRGVVGFAVGVCLSGSRDEGAETWFWMGWVDVEASCTCSMCMYQFYD